MRAKEFIVEYSAKSHGTASKVSAAKDANLPGVFVQKQLRNTDPYMQYRYGLAVAASRAARDHDIEFSQESGWAENLVQVLYVPEDEETIQLASKLMGVKATRITDNASRESNSTESVSPVSKPKRNRFGV
jgi:hypothetical protein